MLVYDQSISVKALFVKTISVASEGYLYSPDIGEYVEGTTHDDKKRRKNQREKLRFGDHNR